VFASECRTETLAISRGSKWRKTLFFPCHVRHLEWLDALLISVGELRNKSLSCHWLLFLLHLLKRTKLVPNYVSAISLHVTRKIHIVFSGNILALYYCVLFRYHYIRYDAERSVCVVLRAVSLCAEGKGV
jgi:hypothetical protein